MKILSIGMIVKNEEKRLEATLQALQPLRDAVSSELIIADTGSTDNTLAIAKHYGDKVFSIPWDGDFAKARNATLAKATGQWFFYLDADEVLRSPEELIHFFRLPNSKKYNCIKLAIYNVTSEVEDSWAISWGNRMFRRGARVYFTGKIHETVPVVQPEYILRETNLHHFGYNNDDLELIRKKSQRNSQLIEEELLNTKDNLQKAKLLLDYADAANISKQAAEEQQALEKAKEAAELLTHLDSNKKRNYFLARAYSLILKGLFQQKDWEGCRLAGEDYFKVQPLRGVQDLDVLFCISGALYMQKEYQSVIEYGEQYCKLLGEDLLEVGQSFILITINKRNEMLLWLYDCYEKLGQWQLAWERISQIDQPVVNGYNIMQMCFNMAFSQDIAQRVPVLFEKMGNEQCRENIQSTLVAMAQKNQGEKRNEYLEALRRLPLSITSIRGLLRLTDDATEFLQLLEEQQESLLPEDKSYLLQQMILLNIPASILLNQLNLINMDEYLEHLKVDKQQFSSALVVYYQAGNPDQLLLPELYLARYLLTYGLFMEQQSAENITSLWPLFLDYGDAYIRKLYSEEVWQEETLYTFQTPDRFLYYGLKCEKARAERDFITSVQMLKKGLEICPDTKKIVQVILENIKQESVTPEGRRQQELQILASHVKQEIVAHIKQQDYVTAQTLLDQLAIILIEDPDIAQLQERILQPDKVLH